VFDVVTQTVFLLQLQRQQSRLTAAANH